MILIYPYNYQSDVLVIKNDNVIKLTISSNIRILALKDNPEIKTELVAEMEEANIYKISRKTNGN